MKHLLLILNPISGMKKATKNLADIISVFNRAGFDTHVFITARQGDATNAVKTLGKKMDLIVCCGGDGTFNETLTGLIEEKLKTPLGYIPTGSTNDFANSLRLSNDPVKAAENIVNGTVRPYDIGKFNTRFFSYVASFGAFTKTSYSTPQNIKNVLGHMAYLLEGIQELSKLQTIPIRLEFDGTLVTDEFLFGAVCNSTSLGGVLTFHPSQVDMSDGKLEVLLVRAPRNLQELHECILALRDQEYNCSMITFRSAEKITVKAPSDMAWSLDGERANGDEIIRIEPLHHALNLIH